MEFKFQNFKDIYLSHRAKVLCYLNIGFSVFELIAFYWIGTPIWFLCVISLRLVMSGFLFYGHRQKHAKKCQIWCLYESCMIVLIMAVALSKFIKLSNVGIVVVFLSFVFKMYSLWIVYYFSLEVETDISVYFRQNLPVQIPQAVISKPTAPDDNPTHLLERSQNIKNEDKQNIAEVEDNSPVKYSVIFM